MSETNPNPHGANGVTSDPREQVCWEFYVESIINGQENAYASAIKAGYSEDSARNVTMRDWFKERLGKLKRKDMLSNAEKLLAKVIMYEHMDEDGKVNVPLLAQQIKVSETLVTTLGKNDGYSTKNETDITSGGQPINIQVAQEIATKNNL